MNKPVTILQREFQTKLVELINNSNLPAFVLVPIMEQALDRVREIEEQQYQADLAAFQKGAEDNGKITEAE